MIVYPCSFPWFCWSSHELPFIYFGNSYKNISSHLWRKSFLFWFFLVWCRISQTFYTFIAWLILTKLNKHVHKTISKVHVHVHVIEWTVILLPELPINIFLWLTPDFSPYDQEGPSGGSNFIMEMHTDRTKFHYK